MCYFLEKLWILPFAKLLITSNSICHLKPMDNHDSLFWRSGASSRFFDSCHNRQSLIRSRCGWRYKITIFYTVTNLGIIGMLLALGQNSFQGLHSSFYFKKRKICSQKIFLPIKEVKQ